MKTKDKSKRGKLARQSGAAFERKVRADLESKGWIVDKWSNNVEFERKIEMKYKANDPKLGKCLHKTKDDVIGKLIPAKRKYNPFSKALSIGTGFPDFIAFRITDEDIIFSKIIREEVSGSYEVIAVECKVGKYLDKVEKEKCQWLLENNIFSKILIAYKTKVKNKIVVEYQEFKKEVKK